MSVAAYPSEVISPHTLHALDRVRVVGGMTLAARRIGPLTEIVDLAECGGYRIKFPSRHSAALEAAIINTGGGVAGGDALTFSVSAEKGAHVSVSTPTAERIYRSHGPATTSHVKVHAQAGATLAWLPQASILFSGARLQRCFEADVAADANLLMAEVTVFGRGASGEVLGDGLLRDAWRIRRDGCLVFADSTRLDGRLAAQLARPAIAAASSVVGLFVCVSPRATDRLDAVRAAVSVVPDVGVSAWNGMLVMRILGQRLDRVQNSLRAAISALELTPVPQVWST
jgi:urease accessory protein